MNKEDLCHAIYTRLKAEKAGVTKKDTILVVDKFFDIIRAGLINNEVIRISEFGTFFQGLVKAHTHYSPVDGRYVKVKDRKKIYFKLSEAFRKVLNGEVGAPDGEQK